MHRIGVRWLVSLVFGCLAGTSLLGGLAVQALLSFGTWWLPLVVIGVLGLGALILLTLAVLGCCELVSRGLRVLREPVTDPDLSRGVQYKNAIIVVSLASWSTALSAFFVADNTSLPPRVTIFLWILSGVAFVVAVVSTLVVAEQEDSKSPDSTGSERQ